MSMRAWSSAGADICWHTAAVQAAAPFNQAVWLLLSGCVAGALVLLLLVDDDVMFAPPLITGVVRAVSSTELSLRRLPSLQPYWLDVGACVVW